MKTADGFCIAGVALVGWALWCVSPALAAGGLGLLLLLLGVAKHRGERAAPAPKQPSGDAP